MSGNLVCSLTKIPFSKYEKGILFYVKEKCPYFCSFTYILEYDIILDGTQQSINLLDFIDETSECFVFLVDVVDKYWHSEKNTEIMIDNELKRERESYLLWSQTLQGLPKADYFSQSNLLKKYFFHAYCNSSIYEKYKEFICVDNWNDNQLSFMLDNFKYFYGAKIIISRLALNMPPKCVFFLAQNPCEDLNLLKALYSNLDKRIEECQQWNQSSI